MLQSQILTQFLEEVCSRRRLKPLDHTSPSGNPSTPTSFRIFDLPVELAPRLWPAFLRETRGKRLRVDVRRKPARGFLVIQRLTALVRHRQDVSDNGEVAERDFAGIVLAGMPHSYNDLLNLGRRTKIRRLSLALLD
jgi:hypothetical protein